MSVQIKATFLTSFIKEKGFEELTLGKAFDIKKGGKYYLTAYSTTLVAFTVGKKVKETH